MAEHMEIDEAETGHRSLLSRLQPALDQSNSGGSGSESEQDRLNRLLDTPLAGAEDHRRSRRKDEPIRADPQLRMDSALESEDLGLMGRLSRSKLYLLEDSGTIIHHPDIEDREEEEPDFSYLENLDSESPVRDCALHLSGFPLQNLSTSQVFSYVTMFAPKPVGIEWISDTRLCIVYGSPQSTKTSLELLAKTGFDPYPPQNDDPLELRSSQPLPTELRESVIAQLDEKERDRASRSSRPVMQDGLVVAKSLNDRDDSELPEGLRPGARLDIRYAMEADVKARTKARESQWYAKHGRGAGKDRMPILTDKSKYGRYAEALEPSSEGRDRSSNGNSGRRRRSASPGRRDQRRGGRPTAEDLDKELDMFRSGDPVDSEVNTPQSGRDTPRSDRDSQHGTKRRGRAKQEDLDAELDAFLRSRD